MVISLFCIMKLFFHTTSQTCHSEHRSRCVGRVLGHGGFLHHFHLKSKVSRAKRWLLIALTRHKRGALYKWMLVLLSEPQFSIVLVVSRFLPFRPSVCVRCLCPHSSVPLFPASFFSCRLLRPSGYVHHAVSSFLCSVAASLHHCDVACPRSRQIRNLEISPSCAAHARSTINSRESRTSTAFKILASKTPLKLYRTPVNLYADRLAERTAKTLADVNAVLELWTT